MPVKYTPSQGDRTKQTSALLFTQSPAKLLWYDILLFGSRLYAVLGIVFPLSAHSGPLDELYPTPTNVFDLLFHFVFIIAQLSFLFSFVLFFTIPAGFFFLYFVGFLMVNGLLFRIINGRGLIFQSDVDLSGYPEHPEEKWIFINGVSVGKSWLMSNLNMLSLTFKRPITAIHNLTYGIIFDVLECVIQRDFSFATMDTRTGYEQVKQHLTNPKHQKVVLILHSQGGIEGSQILDWLLADLPEDLTRKLEIYTFGNAANHFNNPVQVVTRSTVTPHPPVPVNATPERIIKHIEHYANSGDPIALFGVLNFMFPKCQDNRFVGRVFERTGSGHMLNQHYLDNMFRIDWSTKRVMEENEFMDTEVSVESVLNEVMDNVDGLNGVNGNGDYGTEEGNGKRRLKSKKMVRDLSRLWKYRNGGVPED